MAILLALAALTACQAAAATAPAVPETVTPAAPASTEQPCDNGLAAWRSVATEADGDRLREWHDTWDDAITAARAADASAITAQGPLFDPDRALDKPIPPAGNYRCRIFKLGAKEKVDRAFVAYPAVDCTVAPDGDVVTLQVTGGSQRPIGRIYEGPPGRGVFLGTLVLGDETRALDYGLDDARDMIGYVDRISARRWRLILPSPAFGSLTDVIEITG